MLLPVLQTFVVDFIVGTDRGPHQSGHFLFRRFRVGVRLVQHTA